MQFRGLAVRPLAEADQDLDAPVVDGIEWELRERC